MSIIAETKLWRKDGARARLLRIAIRAPEKDPKAPFGTFRCRVFISGDGWRWIYGGDSFQALDLTYEYIQTNAARWVEKKLALYHDRQLSERYDIRALLLHDYERFRKLGFDILGD